MHGIDEALTRFRRLGGDSLARRMTAAFLDNAQARIDAAGEACGARDFAALEAAAHALKSSAANFGARELTELAREIEARSVATRSPTDAEGLPDLVARLPRTFSEIRSYLETTESGNEEDRGR